MLVRAYRLTDKFGTAILKIATGFGDILLIRTSLMLGVFGNGGGSLFRWLRRLISVIVGFIVWILGLVYGVLRWLWGGISRLLGLGLRRGNSVSGTALTTAKRTGRQIVVSNKSAVDNAMVRRSVRAEIEVGVAEDPLRVQNRMLSGVVVLVLAALIGVVVWATAQQNRSNVPLVPPAGIVGLNIGNQEATPASQNAGEALVLPTAVPTATEAPAVLQAGGTIAYTARQSGQFQTDIWVVPLGSREAIRVTNSPENDRDPAWSPDGTRLAYASRREDSNWDIYVLDMTSAALQQSRMTVNLAFEGRPTWSPDGQFIAYEAYQRDSHLDIFLMAADGSSPPLRLPGSSDTADFSPAWSPGEGRQIAFVSWRDGSKDIFVFDLDTGATTNVTNTPNRHEDHPAWSPDGRYLAFSALEAGIETVFIKDMQNLSEPAQPFRQGREPAWSPDGLSILFAVDSDDETFLVVAPFVAGGVTTEVIRVPRGSTNPTWTAAPLNAVLVDSGGLPPATTDPLYIEQESVPAGDASFRLINLRGIEDALLNERVNDSFEAMRARANEVIGWDFLGDLTDTFWTLDRRPQPGEPVQSWHKTGRAIAFNRSQGGFPENFEVVREQIGIDTYWRVYVRVAEDAQNGQLGEPLREIPWDFAAAVSGDLEAYRQGGRPRASLPRGYYVDLTELAEIYGWSRLPASSDWPSNFNTRNFWVLYKSDGLRWLDAMRELYTESELISFLPTPVPVIEAGQEEGG